MLPSRPHFCCPFIRANMAKEVQAFAVGNDSGMCKADFAGYGEPLTVLLSIDDNRQMPGTMAQKCSNNSDEVQSKRRKMSVEDDDPIIDEY